MFIDLYNTIMMDIEDSMEQFYREKVGAEIDSSLLTRLSDDTHIERIKWFNEGLRFAAMIARNGVDA